MIPYGRQSISENDIETVIRVLRSDYLTQGPQVPRFEKALSDFIGAKHVYALANGTAGLHVAALALGLGKGDAVFVPAITFAATANAVLYVDATPVFVDIDPDSGLMSMASLKKAYQLALEAGLKPKAIFVVHFAGLPCDSMVEMQAFAKENSLSIVDDACHALGAEYRIAPTSPLQKVGSAGFSDISVFSFHPVKHITTGEGGALATADEELAQAIAKLRSHGITKDHSLYLNKSLAHTADGSALNPWYHEMQDLGFNYRLCDIQAALGTSQMESIGNNLRRRREIALAYDDGLKGLSWLKTPVGSSENRLHSYHLYPVQIDFEKIGTSRANFMKRLAEREVGSQVHYIPVHWHPYYQMNSSRWLAAHTPNAKKFYEQELSIPMYHSLDEVGVYRVIETLRSMV